MATAIDAKTGQPVEVPDDQLASALASGAVGYAAGSRVPVVSPTGEVGTVAAEEVSNALAAGYAPTSQQALEQATAQVEYGGIGQQALTLAEGVGSGLSFGGLDFLLPKILGEDYRKSAEGRAKAHETTRMVGTVGAALVPLLFTGGAAAPAEAGAFGAGSALRAATAAPRLVARAGQAVERGVASVLPEATSLLGRVASRAVATGAGAAAEGAAYGMGQALTEQSLGGHEITAERLLAGAGQGAALGLMLGGVVGGGAEALAGAGRGVLGRIGRGRAIEAAEQGEVAAASGESAVEALRRLEATGAAGAETAVATRARARVETAIDAAKEQYIQLTIKANPEWGKAEEALLRKIASDSKELIPTRARLIAEQDAAQQSILKELTESANARKDLMSDAMDLFKGDQKAALIESKIHGTQRRLALDEADNIFATTRADVLEMIQDVDGFGNEKLLRGLNKLLDAEENALSNARGLGKGKQAKTEAFMSLDRTKRAIQKDADRVANMIRNQTDPFTQKQLQNTYDVLNKAQERIRGTLEREDLWQGAARMQKELNARWSPQIEMSKEVNKRFITDFGKDPNDIFVKGRVYNPKSVSEHMSNLDRYENSLAQKAWNEELTRGNDLMKVMREHYGKEFDAIYEPYKAHAAKLAQSMQAAEKNLAETKALARIMQAEGSAGIGAVLGTIGGAALTGPFGAAAGGVLGTISGAISSPFKTLRTVAILENMSKASARADSRVGLAVKDFFKTSANAVAKATEAVTPSARSVARLGTATARRDTDVARSAAAVTGGNARSTYEDVSRKLTAIRSNPQAAVENIGSKVSVIAGDAPNVTRALTQTVLRGYTFLDEKLPKPPGAQTITPQFSKWQPTDEQTERFARYARAVSAPMQVIEDFRDGKLTPEAVEALRVVYPNLYANLQEKVAEEIGNLKSDVPYQTKIQLGLLLGVPTDPSLDPKFVAIMQSAYTGTTPNQQPTQASPSAPKRPLRSATTLRSGTDSIEALRSR